MQSSVKLTCSGPNVVLILVLLTYLFICSLAINNCASDSIERWMDCCVAPVQEIFFVKENATTEKQHIPQSSHLHEVSAVYFAVL